MLNKKFFDRKTAVVAEDLLGKFLVRKIGNKITKVMITEVEAYVGPHDLACHSARGRTPRNTPMFCEAGTIYVYFTYGMHWMLNIVTEERDYPAAVLIRGTESITGPGRLTKKYKIDNKLNGKMIGKKTGLWIEDGSIDRKVWRVMHTPRIGIDSAGPVWVNKKLRFVLEEK
jgi:DNA-3-methyladenine glycosylase